MERRGVFVNISNVTIWNDGLHVLFSKVLKFLTSSAGTNNFELISEGSLGNIFDTSSMRARDNDRVIFSLNISIY